MSGEGTGAGAAPAMGQADGGQADGGGDQAVDQVVENQDVDTQVSSGEAQAQPAGGKATPRAKVAPKPTAKTEAQQVEEMFDVKIANRVQKLTKKQVIEMAQRAGGAEEAHRSKAETERLANQFLNDLLGGDVERAEQALARAGVDAEEFIGRFVQARAQKAQVDPAEAERRRMEARLADTERQLQAERQKAREARQRELDERNFKHYHDALLASAQRVGLTDPGDLDAMAEIAIEFIDRYGIELTSDQIANELLVRRHERDEGFRGQIQKMSGEQIYKLIGKEAVHRLMQHTLQLHGPGRVQPRQPEPVQTNLPTAEGTAKATNDGTYRERMARLGIHL